jgi:hypothetical protein
VFSPDDPYLGVDLDDGLPKAERAAITRELDSYAETSVSGDGVHVIVRASLNGHGRNRKGPFEVYDKGRYFTFTGNHVAGTPATIEERQDQLEQVLDRFLPKSEPQPPQVHNPSPVGLDDNDLIAKAQAARNGHKFSDLYYGIWEDAYGSRSETDLALCNLLRPASKRPPTRTCRTLESVSASTCRPSRQAPTAHYPELPNSRCQHSGQRTWPFGHLRSPCESCSINRMTCEECGHEAIGRAQGWEALLVDLDDDGQDEVVFYCPVCAAREFHSVE